MFDLKNELKELPNKPGVYIMKNSENKIIYIGKAKILKNRVKQYFLNSPKDTKTMALVSNIESFEYIITDSELEALILECNLIKKHKPKYNILLKDDKSYPYIKIYKNCDYPYITWTRNLKKDGSRYFGAYSSVSDVKHTIEAIRDIIPLRTCRKNLDKNIKRPCLNYHIKRCLAPCCKTVSKEYYNSLVEQAISILSGKYSDIVDSLTEKMNEHSKNLEFEKAALIRDRINALKNMSNKQKMLNPNMENRDVIGLYISNDEACIQVFKIRDGKMNEPSNHIIEINEGTKSEELIEAFIKQYYNDAIFIPNEISLPININEANLIELWLSNIKKKKVKLNCPQKGNKYKQVVLANNNAKWELEKQQLHRASETNTINNAFSSLMTIMSLDDLPHRIEAYDISNTGNDDIVGGMVVFINGKPCKKEYRRFKIKGLHEQDDYSSMSQMLERRLKKLENKEFGNKPDLILIDGGKGHLKVVNNILEKLDIKIRVAAMKKDKNHRTKALVYGEKEYELSNYKDLFRLITRIQDETHRYTLEYNQKTRKRRNITSELDNIYGIGDKKKKGLYKKFGSLNKIKMASKNELLEVEGINEKIAENIMDYFKNK